VLLNSDADVYWGGGYAMPAEYRAEPIPMHGRARSLNLVLPPLATVILAPIDAGDA